MKMLMLFPNRFTENNLQVPRAYSCLQLLPASRATAGGSLGELGELRGADTLLYSAAQAEENGVSTA